jgi:hypothetical protein
MADQLGVEAIDREAQTVVFKFRQPARVDPERLVALVQRRPDLSLMPPNGLRLDLRKAAGLPRGDAGTESRAVPQRRVLGATASRPRTVPASGPSWWTARATAGEVKPGFSKAEMLKPAAEDPSGEHGVFTRVGRLLSALLG